MAAGEHPAKTIARWVTLGALFLLPFTVTIIANSMFFPFITGKGFFFRIVVEIAVAGWAVLAIMDKRYRPRWTWISVALVALVAWLFIADLFAVNPQKAFWSNFERMEGWITFIHLLALFFVMNTVLRAEKKWRAWWYTSIIASLYVIGYSFMQLAGLATVTQGGVRVDSTLGNATYLAVYMLYHVFVGGWLALTTDKKWLRYLLLAYAVVSGYILFATATRGTILGLAGGLFLAALLTAFTMGKRARKWATGGIVLILVIAGGFWMAKDTGAIRHDPVLRRIASISLQAGDTRFTIWHMALEGFAQDPKTVVLGWGQEGFNYVFNKYYDPSLYTQEQWFDRAHNAFIDMLVQGGLPAFIFYLGLFIAAVYMLWRKETPFNRTEQIALTSLLAGYAFHNLFVFDNITSYLLFIAVLAMIESHAGKKLPAFEEAPEASEKTATTIVWPASLVVLLVVIFTVDVPGINAATGLITAMSPSPQGIAGNIAAWKQEVAHPAFASQEVREQLLTYAMQVAGQSSVSTKDKQELASLAITQMQKEVQEVPKDARLRFELAIGYAAFGDYQNALKQIEVARQLSPKKETIIIQEGVIRLQSGDTKGAIHDFKTAYQLAPQFKDLAAYGAAADILGGKQKEASTLLQQSFGTTTVDKPILIQAYVTAKDYQPLIAIFEQRAAQPNSSIDTQFQLAVAYAAAGNIHKAVAQVEKTIAANPKAKQAGDQLIQQIRNGNVTK